MACPHQHGRGPLPGLLVIFKGKLLPTIHNGTQLLLNLALGYFVFGAGFGWLWPLVLIYSGLFILNILRPYAFSWWGPILGYWSFLLCSLIIGGTYVLIQLSQNSAETNLTAIANSVLFGSNLFHLCIISAMVLSLISATLTRLFPNKDTFSNELMYNYLGIAYEKYTTDSVGITGLAAVGLLTLFAIFANVFFGLVPPMTLIGFIIICSTAWKVQKKEDKEPILVTRLFLPVEPTH
ncbi:hypothetical protein HY994_05690 [Candidatus Micrarchaeota archaeon]|nr:hypothetical protein [Candidatus Micrarchaeota archaeon]